MIRFKSLRFKNAVTFGDVKPIPLEKLGRVFVSGDNQDTGGSNGAGKSTIFEVLQHILFSTTSKGFARNKFADSGYRAQLDLEVDGHDYKILQYRGSKKEERRDGYRIWKDDVEVTPKGTRHIQDCINYIKEAIGISEAEFQGYIYLAQEGSGHVLISGKGSDKRNYLSDLFTLDRYDSVKEGVEEELAQINADIGTLSEKAAVRDELSEQLSGITMTEDDFKEYFSSLRATKAFVEQKYETWEEAMRKADKSNARIQEREQTEIQLNSIFPDWKGLDVSQTTAERQTKLRSLVNRIDKLEGLKDLTEEKSDLESKYIEDLNSNEGEATAALGAARSQISVIQNNVSLIKRRIVLEEKLPDVEGLSEDIPQRLKTAETALGVMSFQLGEAEGSLKRLTDLTGTECPTCGQSLDTEALEKQREKSESIKATVGKAISTARTEVKALEVLDKKLGEHVKLQAQIGELPVESLEAANLAISNLATEISRLEQVVEQARENARTAKRLGELAVELTKFPSSFDPATLEDYKEKASKLNRQIEKLNTLRALKIQLESMPEIEIMDSDEYAKVTDLKTHYEAAKRELAVQISEAKHKKASFTSLMARVKELEKDLSGWESTQHRKNLFEAMKTAYGPKGLKIHQLKKICNAICRTLPKYTSVMFQEPRIEFFVDNDPEIAEIEFYVRRFLPGGSTEEYPVGKLSGGERKRLAVAFIFSLADLVAPRKKSNLIILDEVGDGLDQVGEYAFASQLMPQLRQETVIITSHRPGIEAAQFDGHWTVRKKNNKSTLRIG